MSALFATGYAATNMRVVSKRRRYIMVSVLAIAVGLGFMLANVIMGNGAFNLDVEFTGGTDITIELEREFDVADIQRIVLEATGEGAAQIQPILGTNSVAIRMAELGAQQRQALITSITAEYDLNPDEHITMIDVSATISGEMQRSAIIAIVLACAAMMLYIAVRFRDMKIGLSMIIAAAHDVIIVLLFYSVLRIPLSNSFIAAMLTVLGFSINATIIIFDRFRENRKLAAQALKDNAMMGKRKIAEPNLEEQLDLSINQTILRCVYTALFVLVVSLCLYILGVPAIRDFTLPIIIATICGTYSSVFLSGPIYYMLVGGKEPAAAG